MRSSSSFCSCSWRGAVATVAILQFVRGFLGTAFASTTIVISLISLESISLHKLKSSSSSPSNTFSPSYFVPTGKLGPLVGILLALLHILYLYLANALLYAIESNSYSKFKIWLWTMTILTTVETLWSTIFIIQHILPAYYFLGPAFNLVGLWIVHRYVLKLLITHCGVNAITRAVVQGCETATQVTVELENSDSPPNYEECIAAATAQNPILQSSVV